MTLQRVVAGVPGNPRALPRRGKNITVSQPRPRHSIFPFPPPPTQRQPIVASASAHARTHYKQDTSPSPVSNHLHQHPMRASSSAMSLPSSPFRHAITFKFFLFFLQLQFLLILGVGPTPTWALHESDAGVVDWHKHLIGSPLVGAHVTAPSFLVYEGKSTNSSEKNLKKSLVVTATVNNVLGVLDSDDGSVLWRYIFDPEDRITGYYKSSQSIATLSGPGGATLRLFNALSGTLILEKRLHHPSLGTLAEPAHVGKHVVFVDGDEEGQGEVLYVLTNGCTVSSVNATSGEILWTWTAEDRGSLTIHSHLHFTPSALYVTGLSKSIASFTLHLTTLSPTTGAVIHTSHVPSSIADPLAHLTLLHTPTPSSPSSFKPTLLWIETSTNKQTSLRYLPLTSSLKDKPRPLQGTGFASILPLSDALGAGAAHAVILGEDGRGYVLRAQGTGEEGGRTGGVGVSLIGEFKAREEGGLYAADVGGNGGKGDVNVVRVGWAHEIEKASVDVFTSLGAQAAAKENLNATRWDAFAFAFDTRSHGIINHVTLDSTSTSEHRVVITTSTGSIQLWTSSSTGDLHQEPKWIREEALAGVILAEFVEIPPANEEGKHGLGGAGVGGEAEGFMKRLGRQIIDAQDFPRYVVNFVKRFITGSYETPSSSPLAIPLITPDSSDPTHPPTLARDAFGFRQLIILTTLHGKIYALDSLTGTIVWSRVLGMGWVGRAGQGGRVVPVKVFTVKSVGEVGGWGHDGEGEGEGDGGEDRKRGGGPEVVIVAQRRADNSLVDTVVFHIDALTGADRGVNARTLAALAKDGSMAERPGDVLEGEDVIQGPVVEAYMVQLDLDDGKKKGPRKVVLLLDEFLQVYLYPSTPLTESAFASLLKSSSSNNNPKTRSVSLSFPLRTSIEGRHRITGHTIALPPEHEKQHKSVAHPTWSLTFPSGEDVQMLVPQTRGGGGGVASLGRVLGNRATLYKYLDPRLFVVQTVVRPKRGSENGMCGIYVVDGVKGTVVYHAEVAATSGQGSTPRCDVKTTMVENWLVYHYYEPEVAGGSVGGAKGYRMVSVEFYEGPKGTVDQKIESSDLSPYSNDTLNYAVYEQSYVFPSAITALATTNTKFGITSKDVIVATKSRKVHYIPKRLLDPRRPNRKPTAEEQQEEFLIQYEPLLAEDPRRTISHGYDVANVQKILTSPALLESTSLVFAFGLDMFLTRMAPSSQFDVLSEGFNKLQLVLTVSALALGIVVTRPMVRRKSLREKWYQS